jgi:hypothetical protein
LLAAPELPGASPAQPVAPIIAAKTPPAPAPPAAPSEPILAGRELAGQVCPGCHKQIFLGDEVIQCSRCGVASHLPCWKKNEGCVSEICVPPAAVPVAAEPAVAAGPAGTVPCPVCAEPIPEDAAVCPYCAEPIGVGMAPPGAMAPMGMNLPTTFQSPSGKKWSFNLQGEELLAESYKSGEKIRINRRESNRVTIRGNKVIIRTGGSQEKIKLDDIALVAIDYWATGRIRPRTSSVARDALATAIFGIFCCQIICGPYAVKRANDAQQEIDMYPSYLQGEGLATAAKIIGIIDIVLFVIGFFLRMSRI